MHAAGCTCIHECSIVYWLLHVLTVRDQCCNCMNKCIRNQLHTCIIDIRMLQLCSLARQPLPSTIAHSVMRNGLTRVHRRYCTRGLTIVVIAGIRCPIRHVAPIWVKRHCTLCNLCKLGSMCSAASPSPMELHAWLGILSQQWSQWLIDHAMGSFRLRLRLHTRDKTWSYSTTCTDSTTRAIWEARIWLRT